MEESQQDVVTKAERMAGTEPLIRQPAVAAGTGNVIFDVRDMAVYYGAFKAVTDVTMPI